MPTEEEARAAQKKLDAAVEEFIAAMEWNRDLVLTGWMLIADQTGYDSEGNSGSAHPMAYMNGSMPDSTALGLCEIAKHVISGTGRWGVVDYD